ITPPTLPSPARGRDFLAVEPAAAESVTASGDHLLGLGLVNLERDGALFVQIPDSYIDLQATGPARAIGFVTPPLENVENVRDFDTLIIDDKVVDEAVNWSSSKPAHFRG